MAILLALLQALLLALSRHGPSLISLILPRHSALPVWLMRGR